MLRDHCHVLERLCIDPCLLLTRVTSLTLLLTLDLLLHLLEFIRVELAEVLLNNELLVFFLVRVLDDYRLALIISKLDQV